MNFFIFNNKMLLHEIAPDDKTKRITSVRFGVMSPQRIIDESVAHIHLPITKNDDYTHTLFDPRLGATSTRLNAVSFLDLKKDTGNFGHLVLAKPCFHPEFHDHVRQICNLICLKCANLRLSPQVKEEKRVKLKSIARYARFKHLIDNVQKPDTECTYCGELLPKVSGDKSANAILGLRARYKGKDNKNILEFRLTAEYLFKLFKRISDEDADLMGLNPETTRPEWLIITVLPIPPPSVRPSVVAENGKTSEDDLTHALNSIIKYNQSLKTALNSTATDKDKKCLEAWTSLQLHVATLMNNETSSYRKSTNRANRPLKTFRGRHKGKTGRFRGNIMGKRVGSSARTVITGDPNLSVNQIGVPQEVAEVLTYPELVNRFNIHKLTTIVNNDHYPSAVSIKRRGRKRPDDLKIQKKNLKTNELGERDKISLQIGDTVYRHMMDGDIVLFNRQPSLHKMSMMAHYAKILSGRSFRFNPNVTPPYNADFDGDEMNLHLPQTPVSVYELRKLALVSTQFVSPQAGIPILGCVQDSLTGAYRLSAESTRGLKQVQYIDVRRFMRLRAWVNTFNGKQPVPLLNKDGNIGWTSRQLLSTLLPNISAKYGDLNIKNGQIPEPIKDKEGKLVFLPIDKTLIGKGASGGLIHIAWSDLGHNSAQELLDNFSRVISQWILIDGFSAGLSDIEISRAKNLEIGKILDDYRTKSKQLINGLHIGQYDSTRKAILGDISYGLVDNMYEQFEKDILYLLDKCRIDIEDATKKSLTSLRADNRFKSMVDSGARGSASNTLQIISFLGQQDIGGRRIQDCLKRRPIPHVTKDDISPLARGWVEQSFLEGLDPIAYIYHGMAGRIGVISTSIKTAETGYVSRKLMKILEDLSVRYDNTVRSASNNIVQYIYGNDGFDGSQIELIKLNHLYMSLIEFEMKYVTNELDLTNLTTINEDYEVLEVDLQAINDEKTELLADREYLLNKYVSGLPEKVYSPINFERLIQSVSSNYCLTGITDLTPAYIYNKVNELINTFKQSLPERCIKMLVINTRLYLSCKKVLFDYILNKSAFNSLLNLFLIKFKKSLAVPGEACGPISAQSIGEPSTQMTLSSFHHTGIGAKANISRGVPRLKEILSLAKTLKTPSITIYIKKDILNSYKITNQTELSKITGMTVNQINNLLKSPDITDAECTHIKSIVQKELFKYVKKIESTFNYLVFSDLVLNTKVIYDVNNDAIPEDNEFINAYFASEGINGNTNPWVLRFELDAKKMQDNNLNTYHILQILQTYDQDYKSRCVSDIIFSDENFNTDKLICRINIKDNKTESDPIQLMNILESQILNLKIKGIHGISKTSVRIIPDSLEIKLENGAIIPKYHKNYEVLSKREIFTDQYVIDTYGSNLLEVLISTYVDPEKTITNDINEIYELYGIEAAKNAIVSEIMDVMEYAGVKVNNRHVLLLADIMTSRGELLSVDRFGQKKSDSSIYSMASFEESTARIVRASIFGDEDKIIGVSSNLVYGQTNKIGTGSFEILIDDKALMNIEEPMSEKKFNLINMDKSNLVNSISNCVSNNFRFDL